MTQESPVPQYLQELHEFFENKTEVAHKWHGRDLDWFLQRLVQLAQTWQLEVGITLTTPSGLVTGTLISAQKYFKDFAELFAGAMPPEQADGIREVLTNYGLPKEGSNELQPQYIHLKGAKFMTGDEVIPSNHGVLWRGTITSISGFSMGKLGG